jgi:hypothetical protein
MESLGTVSLRELKISEEIRFSRTKARLEISRLAGGTKVEAFEHLPNSPKSKDIKISKGGETTTNKMTAGRS